MGKITLSQSLCGAVAPIFYAALVFPAGAKWALAVSAMVALGTFAAVVMVARTVQLAERSQVETSYGK
jgi:hypothetical protein